MSDDEGELACSHGHLTRPDILILVLFLASIYPFLPLARLLQPTLHTLRANSQLLPETPPGNGNLQF